MSLNRLRRESGTVYNTQKEKAPVDCSNLSFCKLFTAEKRTHCYYSRGSKLSEEIEASSYIVLNEKCHTRITSTCKSSPDITLCNPSLVMNTCDENRKSAGV